MATDAKILREEQLPTPDQRIVMHRVPGATTRSGSPSVESFPRSASQLAATRDPRGRLRVVRVDERRSLAEEPEISQQPCEATARSGRIVDDV